MTLDLLPPGAPARITAIATAASDPLAERRLRELGFDEGVEVALLHAAPFGGDPIAVRVGPTIVALRRAQAALVEVDPAR
jgi:ferrous iron transport protein A